MTTSPSKAGRAASAVFAGLMLCVLGALVFNQFQRMNHIGALQRWRPPADVQPRIVEGRFETETSGYSYRYGYKFTTTDGQALPMSCFIGTGARVYGTPHHCLDLIPEELRGQTVRVGYIEPVLEDGKDSGYHLILKVWRGDRLLLTRPINNVW